jgi:hypothetical protein
LAFLPFKSYLGNTLKTVSPMEVFCSYYMKEFLQPGTIFLTKQTSTAVLLTMHTSISSMITFLSGCQAIFFTGLPLFLSLLSKLMFFTAVTDTSYYIALIVSTQQIGKIRFFNIASHLHMFYCFPSFTEGGIKYNTIQANTS